ncbi:response regulator, partial [Bacillus sp. IG2]|uniref:response regulator n=1 Tax=Bacillus sp. IG2 TaxID=3075931 RepID=UPI0028F77DE9
DVMMPVMDGLTATRHIRQNPRFKKLPIITLTAKAMPDDQQRCIEAGANDYMAKPLDVDKLLSLVRVWSGCPTDRGQQAGLAGGDRNPLAAGSAVSALPL